MLINAIDPEESRIAVVEDGVLQELHVELANREAYLGNIYKGKVVNIEPSIGAAFVAFGGRVNGFLHVSDVLPAYGRDEFRLEDVIEGRARVDVDDGPESMQQALSDADDDDEDDDGDTATAPSRKSSRRGGRRKKAVAEESADGAGDADTDAHGAAVDGEDDEAGAEDDLEPVIEAVEDVAVGIEVVDQPDDVEGADLDQDGEGEHEGGAGASAAERSDVSDGDVADGDVAEGGVVEDASGEGSGDGGSGDGGSGDGEDGVDPDADHGFGDGLSERPLEMAAADPSDEPDGGQADQEAPIDGPSSAGLQASEEGGAASVAQEPQDAPDADGDADGEAGAPRRKRSRSRRSRSRKRADADAPAADPADAGDASVATQEEAREQPARKKRGRRGSGRDGSANDRRAPRGNRPTIDQLLKKGQEVVVQITKEGIGNKGPTLTTYVSLPGRSLVLMPSLPKCGVSRKIEDGRERRRLKRIVKELDETGSGGIGFIVRTAGINKSLEDVQRDRDYLKKIWEMVAQRLQVTKAPSLLYQESDLVLKAMRDQFTPDIADVVVDSEDVYMRIRDFAEKLMPVMAERIKRHAVTTPLFHSFGIEKDVEALYEPQVDLSNGASIVIDQAEALVAIDVNSGKYKAGGQGSDETAYRTNLEAIPEIVRQLRLRDLGGLIIIDFIDMLHEKHRRSVERKMIEALRGDRARIKVGRISPFGMMEITRQRVGPGLKRTVFMQCPHCKGAGWSRTVQSKALSVLREARALVNLKGYSMLQVFVAPPVADYLVNYKRRAVLDVEDAVGKSIVFRPEASYPIDVVHYRFLTGDGQEARVAIPAGLGVKA